MKKLLLMSSCIVFAGCTDATNSTVSPATVSPPTVSLQQATIDSLAAGYLPLKENNPCNGTRTGTIRIKVNQILRNLSINKNIGTRTDVDVVVPTSGGERVRNVMRPAQVPGFPTVFDLETVATGAGGSDETLVDQGKYVRVRVIFNMKSGDNNGVRFLYPGMEDTNAKSAILRTTNTDDRMFCSLSDITYETVNGRRERAIIEFGIQSIGAPAYGGFGIGLLVVSSTGDQTPIIIDPNVKNRG